MIPVTSNPLVDDKLYDIVMYFKDYIENKDNKIKNFKKEINNVNYHNKIKNEVAIVANEMAKECKVNFIGNIKEIENAVSLRKNWLESLAEEMLMKYLTSRTDLHLGNIGLTNYGDFRYFDPANQKWTSKINV